MKIWYGIHPGYEEFILNRIKESRRKYSRREQRAELLIRNPQFMEKWQDIQETHKKAAMIGGQKWADDFARLQVNGLCERWGISKKWDATKASLSKFIETEPGLVYHPIWAGLPVDPAEARIFPDNLRPDYLYIKIDPWTLRDDVVAAWPRVEKLKKVIFGYSGKGKSNFGQALCWYDLHKQQRWGYGKIASVWIQEEAPHIRDTESFRITVREGIKRIDRYIKRLTPPTPEVINIPQ